MEPSASDNLLLLALGQGAMVSAGVDLTIHDDDEMLRVLFDRNGRDRQLARAMYLESGLALWQALRRVLEWRFGQMARVGKVLDFASGYGRVTRFLVRDLPPERVWVADISAPAVDFQRRQFGVNGFESAPLPGDLVCNERFDGILVSSLFTHLPEATFAAWLRRLWLLLAPGGVFAFSVHDAGVLPADRLLPASGLLFETFSESASLAAAQYGSTWVSEAFVRGALGSAAPGASALRLPKALANYQDLYVVVAEPRADFAALAPAGAPPQVFIEHCDLTPPDRLEISGWVTDRVSGRLPVEIRALVGAEILECLRVFTPRPDVAALFPVERVEAVGWRLELRVPGEPPDFSAPLRIEAVEPDGQVWTLDERTIEGAMLRTARLQRFMLHSALERLRTEEATLRQELARAGAACQDQLGELRREMHREVDAREARLAAMQASFFWKLRNRWFALKRRLRLTDEP